MFDPYHQWLGIPRSQRPPTHYQLLGIAPDERDPDVIEAATVRQSAYVRNFQTGPHARDCARILNELAQARGTLRDTAKRAAYVARLPKAFRTSESSAGKANVQVADGTPPDVIRQVIVEAEGLGTNKPRSRRPGRGSRRVLLIPLLNLALIAVAIASVAGVLIRFSFPSGWPHLGSPGGAKANKKGPDPGGKARARRPPIGEHFEHGVRRSPGRRGCDLGSM